MMIPKKAIIKFNGGRGALLCNRCNVIIKSDFDPTTIEDKYYYCGGDHCKKTVLVDRDCHYLDGICKCKSIEECKYATI